MYRLWGFYADMNVDGRITISDVWLWIKWLFFYPGDLVIAGLIEYLPTVAAFLELTYNSYSGTLSGFVSGMLWLIFAVFVAGFLATLDNR